MMTREEVRQEFIERGNRVLLDHHCPLHNERAYLTAGSLPTSIVIFGCCQSYIEGQALAMGFRVDRTVEGGKPTLVLSAGLQVL